MIRDANAAVDAHAVRADAGINAAHAAVIIATGIIAPAATGASCVRVMDTNSGAPIVDIANAIWMFGN